jgi:hypothetical protein
MPLLNARPKTVPVSNPVAVTANNPTAAAPIISFFIEFSFLLF